MKAEKTIKNSEKKVSHRRNYLKRLTLLLSLRPLEFFRTYAHMSL